LTGLCLGETQSVDEAARKDDTGHGKGCIPKGDHHLQVDIDYTFYIAID